jgi:hypothetical protein
VGLGASVDTLRTGYPRVQASSQDNGSCLPAGGSSGAATCPSGSSFRLLARGSSRAATCHLGSNTHHLAHGSSGAATCPEDRFCRLQANKQISPGVAAIMISIGAHSYLPRHYATRAAPHARKAYSRWPIKCRRDVWQAGCSDPSQCRVVQQLWATGRLQPGVSTVGHLSATATSLVTQQHSTVPMTECRVAGNKTRRAHAVEDIIGYS